MGVITITKKKKNTYIDIKLLKTEMINVREFDLLAKRQLDNYIPVEYGKRNKKVVRFDVTNLTTLKNYLHIVVNRRDFLNIVLSIIETLKTNQNVMLYNKNMLLDSNYIFFNQVTKKLMYIYVPITNYNTQIDVKAFFYNLAFGTVFNQSEDLSYVSKYMDYFRNCLNFSLFELEKLVKELNVVGTTAVSGGVYAHSSKLLTRDDNVREETNGNDSRFVNVEVKRPTANSFVIEDESYGGTTVLGAQDYGTTVLSGELAATVMPYLTLTRMKNNEQIDVKKNNFVVGKSKSADYCIEDNSAISRNHMTLLIKDGKFYVVDNGSTNGTWVEGEKLVNGMEKELVEGQKLKLADEEFVVSRIV